MNMIQFSKRPNKKAPRLTLYLVSPVPVIISLVLLRRRLVHLKFFRLCLWD